MTGHLHLLHRSQVAIGLVAQHVELGSQDAHLVRDIEAPLRRHFAKPGDLVLQFDNIAFERQMC